MNICVFCNLYHPKTTGVATVVDNIAQNLDRKVRFSIVPAFDSPKLPLHLENAISYVNYEHKLFSKVMSLFFGSYIPLTSLCFKALNSYALFNLIHCHTLWPNSIIPLIKLANKVPCVLTPHNGLNLRNWGKLYRVLVKKALLSANMVIALSATEEEEIAEFAPGAKTTIIYNGINVLSSEHTRKGLCRPGNVLFVGKVTRHKGVHDLIEAARQIDKEYPDNVLFTLAGDVDDEFAGELPENMRLVGFADQESLDRLYKQANLLVLPSYHEGMPMVILEAMSYGLPVVSTSVGGIPQMVKHMETGLIIPPGDIKRLKESVIALIRDPGLANSFGNAGRKRCCEMFSAARMAERHFELYRSLVGCKS